MENKLTVLEKVISEQELANERLKKRYDERNEYVMVQRAEINALRLLLKDVMQALAVQNAVLNTHAGRNRENMHLIRRIHTELNHENEYYWTEKYRKMDDIPF